MAKPKANSDTSLREGLKETIKGMTAEHGPEKVLAAIHNISAFQGYQCLAKLREELHGHERAVLGKLANVLRRAFPAPKVNKYAQFSKVAGEPQAQMYASQFPESATPDGPEPPQPE
jgi:hypothetical protein